MAAGLILAPGVESQVGSDTNLETLVRHIQTRALLVALFIPGLLAAQRNAGTMIASATVIAHPARLSPLAQSAGRDGTAGAWRLSGRPGAPVGVTFTLPDTLTPARAAGGPPVPLGARRATARWQRPGDAAGHRFDAESGALAVIGDGDDASVRLALAWTPRPQQVPPRGHYLGELVMTLVYY